MEQTLRVRDGESLLIVVGGQAVEVNRVGDRLRVRCESSVDVRVLRRAPRKASVRD